MSQNLPRRFALLFSTVLVCLAPFCIARSIEIITPPNVNYRLSTRSEKEEKTGAETAKATAQQQTMPCDVCTPNATAALQNLLKQYQDVAAKGGWPEWKISKKTLKPGMSDPRVPALRQILAIMGDWQQPLITIVGNPKSENLFDNYLSAGVKRFQARHGLNVDGSLGPSTQAALAVPISRRIVQITSTLARMQERPIEAEDKFILVNLPAYTLYGYDRVRQELTMRVIIGNRQNHTPLFDNEVTDVVFNPPWHVPQRIVRNEMLPKLRKNPSYFINAGFTVTKDGVPVDPMKVDTSKGSFTFRQRPGEDSALGKIKFNIPDDDDVYLHDTNSRKLFAKEDRAMSHGCIRLGEPRNLAYFVFAGMDGWDQGKIDKFYDSQSERDIRVNEVPVHLVYWTAFVDAGGVAHFFNDVYNKDASAQTAGIQGKEKLVLAAK